MANLKEALLDSLVESPDDYDGREALWMAREDLREEQRMPTVAMRLGFGPNNLTTVGAGCATIIMAHLP